MPYQTRRKRHRGALRHHTKRVWHDTKQTDPNHYQPDEHYPSCVRRCYSKGCPSERQIYSKSNLLSRHHCLLTKFTRCTLHCHRALHSSAIQGNSQKQTLDHPHPNHPPTKIRGNKRPATYHLSKQDYGSQASLPQTTPYCTTNARTLQQIRAGRETGHTESRLQFCYTHGKAQTHRTILLAQNSTTRPRSPTTAAEQAKMLLNRP
jgi:hypothetical protein